mgnify:CR=1 FL=1
MKYSLKATQKNIPHTPHNSSNLYQKKMWIRCTFFSIRNSPKKSQQKSLQKGTFFIQSPHLWQKKRKSRLRERSLSCFLTVIIGFSLFLWLIMIWRTKEWSSLAILRERCDVSGSVSSQETSWTSNWHHMTSLVVVWHVVTMFLRVTNRRQHRLSHHENRPPKMILRHRKRLLNFLYESSSFCLKNVSPVPDYSSW